MKIELKILKQLNLIVKTNMNSDDDGDDGDKCYALFIIDSNLKVKTIKVYNKQCILIHGDDKKSASFVMNNFELIEITKVVEAVEIIKNSWKKYKDKRN